MANFISAIRKNGLIIYLTILGGSDEVIDHCILQMDLMETKNNLPANIKVIGCTLEELTENCKTITKEAFKIFALEP